MDDSFLLLHWLLLFSFFHFKYSSNFCHFKNQRFYLKYISPSMQPISFIHMSTPFHSLLGVLKHVMSDKRPIIHEPLFIFSLMIKLMFEINCCSVWSLLRKHKVLQIFLLLDFVIAAAAKNLKHQSKQISRWFWLCSPGRSWFGGMDGVKSGALPRFFISVHIFIKDSVLTLHSHVLTHLTDMKSVFKKT